MMAEHPDDLGYLVRYPDGYVSWSPTGAFEDGYDLLQPSSGKSNISGYRQLSEIEIRTINDVKEHGKKLEDLVAALRTNDELDQRWVSVGVTHLQQGLMCLTRAIAKPEFF